jgi:hypothetical protein
MTKEQCIQWAVMCASDVLPIFEAAYPGDRRPRRAIKAAQLYLLDPCAVTSDMAGEAARAASYAADNAARAASSVAARAAAYAAYAAAYAASNADRAATYAARAASSAASAACDAAHAAPDRAAAYIEMGRKIAGI